MIGKQLVVSAPSNIALVKYWGKRSNQTPLNSSLSLTLKNCVSVFEFSFCPRQKECLAGFLFEKESHPVFESKIRAYLKDYEQRNSWLNQVSFNLSCHNTFPHSAGIASSASAFAALAYGLEVIKSELLQSPINCQNASSNARLGSGSAARSIKGQINIWGEHSQIKESCDLHAIEFKGDLLADLHDSILIIDSGQKAVSSTAGHKLMDLHPFKKERFIQANKNVEDLITADSNHDWEKIGQIIESEALTLHALMMSSTPSYTLMRPNTLAAIEKIKMKRAQGLKCYFTLDAGPNIHLLYREQDKLEVHKFIDEQLKQFCEAKLVIHDQVGNGANAIWN